MARSTCVYLHKYANNKAESQVGREADEAEQGWFAGAAAGNASAGGEAGVAAG